MAVAAQTLLLAQIRLVSVVLPAMRRVGGDGVTVNMVLPGRIDTDRVAALDADTARRRGTGVDSVRSESVARIPAGRYGTPEEFADVAAFLCGERASYVTVAQVRVDGGLVSCY